MVFSGTIKPAISPAPIGIDPGVAPAGTVATNGVRMAKEPHQKTRAELAQDLSTRPDSLIHLTAKAEMARRAAVQDQWRSWIMFASVVIAALAAAASACSAYFAYLSSLHK